MKVEINVRRKGAQLSNALDLNRPFYAKKLGLHFYMGLLKPDTASKLDRRIHSYAMKLTISVLHACSYYFLVDASTSINFREKAHGSYAITI
jgi:hypothetical protein